MIITPVQMVFGNSTTKTITATKGQGNSLIVCVNSYGGGIPSISTVKASGIGLQPVVAVFDDGASKGSWIYILANAPAGLTSVVVTGANLDLTSGNGGICVLEVPGLVNAPSSDAVSSDSDNTGNTDVLDFSSGQISDYNSNDQFLVGTANGFGSITITQPFWTYNRNPGNAGATGYLQINDGSEQEFAGQCNGPGWSSAIAAFEIQPPGSWIRVDGIWRAATPYIRESGVWYRGLPNIRNGGVWQPTE
jgi:hypothetical protein